MRSENLFYLMHKDMIATGLEIDAQTGDIVKTVSYGTKELLPIGARLSPDDLKRWWKNRAAPVSQGNIKRILRQLDYASPNELLIRNLGLNLTDHYWVKHIDSHTGRTAEKMGHYR